MIQRLTVLTLVALLMSGACSRQQASNAESAAAAQPSVPAQGATSPPGASAPGTPGAAGATVPAVKPVPTQLPEIVARVNSENLAKAELEMAIKTLEDRARNPVPSEQRDAVYRQVLDRLIGFHLLVQEAQARKIVPPPWEVDSQLDQIKKQFPSEDAFNQMLKARGVTIEKLRADTARTIAVNQMLKQELEPKLKVTDAETKAFYDQNKARFRQNDSVHASHILIRAQEGADAPTKAKAKSQADDLLKQLDKGASFADLAKTHSQDPGSAPNGGDLGFFSRGQMVPAFEQAAFALKPGQTSGVVQTPFGYHIIRVSETKAGRDLSYDEVKAQIADFLKQQQREQESQRFVDQLRAKGKVQIFI